MINFRPELENIYDGASWLAVNNDGEVHLIQYSKSGDFFYKGIYTEKVYEYEYCLFCSVNVEETT